MAGQKRKVDLEDAHKPVKFAKPFHQTKLSSFFKKPVARFPGKNITNTIDLTLDEEEDNLTLEPDSKEPTGNFSIASGSGLAELSDDWQSSSESDEDCIQGEDSDAASQSESNEFLDMQRKERRNAQRRGQRSLHANIHQVKRRARREEKAAELGKAVVSMVHEAAVRRKVIEKAAISSKDPSSALTALVHAGRKLDATQQIPDSAEIWRHIPLDVKKMLVEFSVNPLLFRYKKWVKRGTLVLDTDEQIDPQKAIYYMRVIAFKDRDALFAALVKFLRESLGHLHFALIMFFALGFSYDCIQEAITDILKPFGHEELAHILFKSLDRPLLESLDICTGVDCSSEHIVTYLGYTIMGSAESRLIDDLTELMEGGAGKQIMRRVTRFCMTNGFIPSAYHIPGLDAAASTAFAFRTNEMLSQIEATCITAAGGLCLNSAPGGFITKFDPPANLRLVVEKGVSAGGTFCLGSDFDASMSDELCGLIDDQVLYQKTIYPEEPVISPTALAALKEAAADVMRCHTGHVIVLWVNKDIPLEDFNGSASGLFTAKVGNAFARRRHIYSLIHSSLPKSGDLTTEQVVAHFGANVDLWPLSIGKPNVTENCLFLSRFSSRVSPIIFVASSSAVGYVVREGLLQKIWNYPSNTAIRDRFLEGHSPLSGETLSSICEPMDHLEKKVKYGTFYASNNGYIDDVGELSIAPIGPGPANLSLLVIVIHDGSIKYQPIVEKLRSQIMYLLYAIVTIACSVAATKLSRDGGFSRDDEQETRSWLTACRDDAELVILDSGIRSELNILKDKLRNYQRATGHLARILPVSVIAKSKKPYQLRLGITTASEHGADREAQFNDLVRKFQGRNELLFEKVRQRDADALFRWFMELSPGKAILPSLSASGILISDEHEEKKKSNTRALNEFWTNSRLANKENKKNKPLDTAELEQKLAQERGIAPADLRRIVTRLSSNAETRQTLGRFSANPTRRSVYRAGFCGNCNELVVGMDQNSAHHCLHKGEKLFLTNTNFRMLERLLYPHHILNDTSLQNLLNKTPQEFGLTSLSVRDTLKFIRSFIANFNKIPKDLYIYIAPNDTDLRWRRASSLDAALPFLITHGFTGQTAEFIDSAVWHDRHLPMGDGHALDYKSDHWSRVRCSCGFAGVQKTEYRKCKGVFVYKHHRRCTLKLESPLRAHAPVHSLFDLPIEHAARIIYYLFVQTDEGQDFTVLFN